MQSGWIEIFFLAMLAGFIGLRLYHVLGRRTGQEHTIGEEIRHLPESDFTDRRPPESRPEEAHDVEVPDSVPEKLRPMVQEIMEADHAFRPDAFLETARVAYQMILQAFWSGDISRISKIISDEIQADLQHNVDQRADRGERVENELLEVDSVTLVGALLKGTMAEVTVQFDAEIISVTRNSEGGIVAGNPGETVKTHDVWTFSRHTRSPDPTWLLVAIDEVDQKIA